MNDANYDAFIELLHFSPHVNTIICSTQTKNAGQKIQPFLNRIRSLRISINSPHNVEKILEGFISSNVVKDLSIWGGGIFSPLANQYFEQILPKLEKIDLRSSAPNVKSLFAALPNCTNLVELLLFDGVYSETDEIDWTPFIKILAKNKTLKRITLRHSRNPFGIEFAKFLGENNTLTQIDVNWKQNCAEELVKAFDKNKTLKCILLGQLGSVIEQISNGKYKNRGVLNLNQ